jgi:hypothetical protein
MKRGTDVDIAPIALEVWIPSSFDDKDVAGTRP